MRLRFSDEQTNHGYHDYHDNDHDCDDYHDDDDEADDGNGDDDDVIIINTYVFSSYPLSSF